ncbi:MAG: hypothetical protein J5762_00525 [Clostridia bacterium]|nr:hypothetical protein [Clostridia bacterium]
MKKTFIRIITITLAVFMTFILSSCTQTFDDGSAHKVTVTVEGGGGTAYATFRGEKVSSASFGDRISIACIADTGYECDGVEVDGNALNDRYFVMGAKDVDVKVRFKKPTYLISVAESVGGSVVADKDRAAYGDEVKLVVTPDFGYYGRERTLLVNRSEIYRGRINERTEVTFVMPHTDVNVSMTFIDSGMNFGENFGDISPSMKGFNSDKFDFSADTGDDPKVSVSLLGSGDANRQVGYVYNRNTSDCFMFTTTVTLTEYDFKGPDESYFAVFFGNTKNLGFIGYCIKKYTSRSDAYVTRRYLSASFESGKRVINSGFQGLIAGGSGEQTSGTIGTSYGGIQNIPNAELNNVKLKAGFVYDGPSGKLHVLLSCFGGTAGAYDCSATGSVPESELVYVRTIELSKLTDFYDKGADGKINFGLYAEAAYGITAEFSEYEFVEDKAAILERFPQIAA